MAKKPKKAQATPADAADASPGDSDAQQPASDATPEPQHPRDEAQPAAQPASQAGPQATGNVPNPSPAVESPAAARSRVRDRLMQHPEWGQIIGTVKEMRLDPKLAKFRAEHRERFIWSEMDRLYPATPPVEGKSATRCAFENGLDASADAGRDLRKNADAPPMREGGVKGLGDIPEGWPALPANASLAAEVGWVQANRLYVVEELPSGGTRVHLDRAHEPAPSRAAIGWLETSIRSYAKYVEVASKVTGAAQDEQEQIRRERLQLDEIRAILKEMMPKQA